MALLSAFEQDTPEVESGSGPPNVPAPRAAAPAPLSPLPGMPSLDTVASQLWAPGGARDQQADALKTKAAAMEPRYAGVESALADQERVLAQRPTPPTIPSPPSRGLRDFLAPSENESPVASIAKLLQAASLFTSSTFGATRRNAVAGMAAMAGAMRGWADGDTERAEASFKDWEANTSKALTDYKLQSDDYSKAITASGQTIEGRMRAASIEAMRHGDIQAALAFQSGDLKEALTYLTGREDASNKMAIAVQKMMESRAEAQRKTAADAETARHHKATEDAAANKLALEHAADEAHRLDPASIELLAQKYAKGGGLDAMGMGKAATESKIQVIKRAAQIAESEPGGIEGQAARKAIYEANAKELAKIQVQRGMVGSFEKAAQRNLAIVDDLSSKLARSNIPALNKWTLASAQKLQGSPEVAEYNAAVRDAISEVAKVVNGITGGGGSTDTARHEIEEILNKEMTPGQITKVSAILRRNMDSRMRGFDDQIDAVKSAMGMKTGAPKTRSVTVNGQTYTIEEK